MRKRALVLVLLLAVALPPAAFGMASFDYPVVAPVVSMVSGDVTVKEAAVEAWKQAEQGMLLATGDTVRTGPASRCELSAATGKIRLYENTVIVIPEVVDEGDKKDLRGVNLEDGAGLFRIRKRGVERGFEVKTPHIIAGAKGTLFAVQTSKEAGYSRVAVYSGVVEVTDLKRTPETLTPLPRSKIMEVLENLSGFGEIEDYEWEKDPWKEWEKGSVMELSLPSRLPAPALAPLALPGGLTVTSDEPYDEGGGRTGPECAPVTDSSGNPIYYGPPRDGFLPR